MRIGLVRREELLGYLIDLLSGTESSFAVSAGLGIILGDFNMAHSR